MINPKGREAIREQAETTLQEINRYWMVFALVAAPLFGKSPKKFVKFWESYKRKLAANEALGRKALKKQMSSMRLYSDEFLDAINEVFGAETSDQATFALQLIESASQQPDFDFMRLMTHRNILRSLKRNFKEVREFWTTGPMKSAYEMLQDFEANEQDYLQKLGISLSDAKRLISSPATLTQRLRENQREINNFLVTYAGKGRIRIPPLDWLDLEYAKWIDLSSSIDRKKLTLYQEVGGEGAPQSVLIDAGEVTRSVRGLGKQMEKFLWEYALAEGHRNDVSLEFRRKHGVVVNSDFIKHMAIVTLYLYTTVTTQHYHMFYAQLDSVIESLEAFDQLVETYLTTGGSGDAGLN